MTYHGPPSLERERPRPPTTEELRETAANYIREARKYDRFARHYRDWRSEHYADARREAFIKRTIARTILTGLEGDK